MKLSTSFKRSFSTLKSYERNFQIIYKNNFFVFNCALSWYTNALDFIPTENVYRVKIYLPIESLHCDNQKYNNGLESLHKALHYEPEMDFFKSSSIVSKF